MKKNEIIKAINNTTNMEMALDYINQNGDEPIAKFSNNIEQNEEMVTIWI